MIKRDIAQNKVITGAKYGAKKSMKKAPSWVDGDANVHINRFCEADLDA